MNNELHKDWQITTAKLTACLCLLAAAQIAGADAALAEGVNNAFGPIQETFKTFVDFIDGDFGRLLATIAVIGLGFLAFAGRLGWFFAGSVILGIGLVFGAKSIVETLSLAVGK